jgi:ABC-type nitrate/sulfonate/bicarbonate transport system ATPase subunit
MILKSLLLADRIYLLTARPARVRLEIDLHQERARGTDMGG